MSKLKALITASNKELKKLNSSFKWSIKVVGKINLAETTETKKSSKKASWTKKPQMSSEAKKAMLARLREARNKYSGVHHVIAALLRGEWVATSVLRKYDDFLQLLNLRKKHFRGGEDHGIALFCGLKSVFGKAKDFLAELKNKGKVVLGIQEATWTKYTNTANLYWTAQ